MFNFFTSPENDIDRGREAMMYFHNQMSTYAKYKGTTLNQMIDVVSKGKPDIFLDAFGFAINANEMRDAQVKDAMVALAQRSSGVIPPNQSQFFNALTARIQAITVTDTFFASPEIAKGMAGDVITGAKEIGDAVIDTGKSLLVIGPILIVAAIVFIGYSRTRQYAGR